MIGYITLGTNDMARAGKFYDDLLADFGATRFMQMDHMTAWGVTPGQPMLTIIRPNDGKAATVGNGVMVALAANSTEQVDRVYKKALSLGGKDEGAVGWRGDTFYAGYFRDLDGNKLNVFWIKS